MIIKMRKKAQNLSEYAIMLGVVIGAVLLSQDMVKKALVGKFKDGANTLTSVKGKVAGELDFGGSGPTDVFDSTTTSNSRFDKTEKNKGMSSDIYTESSSGSTSTRKKLY
jgi:hypothetical protein